MKKKRTIIIVTLIMLISIGLLTTYSLYKSTEEGQAGLSVASPKVRIISEPATIEELDLQTYSNEFSVVNYDENENVTEVGLDYTLSFEATDKKAPIGAKLYRIEDDGNETEMELDENLNTTSKLNFTAGSKQEDKYKLEIYFNLENGKMEENTDFKINLKAIQVQPNE